MVSVPISTICLFTVSGSVVLPMIRLTLRCSPDTSSVTMKSSSNDTLSDTALPLRAVTSMDRSWRAITIDIPSEAHPDLGLITYRAPASAPFTPLMPPASASSMTLGTAMPLSDRIREQTSLSAQFLTDLLGQPRLIVLSSTISVKSARISSGAITIPASQVRAISSIAVAKPPPSQSPLHTTTSPLTP